MCLYFVRKFTDDTSCHPLENFPTGNTTALLTLIICTLGCIASPCMYIKESSLARYSYSITLQEAKMSSAANYALTEEELRIALSQVNCLDQYAAFSGSHTPRVCLPPRNAGEHERWVDIDLFTNQVDTNIRQPDQDRTVLYTGYGYWYTDKLGSYITAAIVSTVIFSILTTPIILLCCIPMIMKMKKVYSPA